MTGDRKSTRLNSSHTIISYAWSSDVCSSDRSEEHTSELQSHDNLVCRLLVEKHSGSHSSHLHFTCRNALVMAEASPIPRASHSLSRLRSRFFVLTRVPPTVLRHPPCLRRP